MQDHEDSDESETDSRQFFRPFQKHVIIENNCQRVGLDEWRQIYLTVMVLKSRLKSLNLPT